MAPAGFSYTSCATGVGRRFGWDGKRRVLSRGGARAYVFPPCDMASCVGRRRRCRRAVAPMGENDGRMRGRRERRTLSPRSPEATGCDRATAFPLYAPRACRRARFPRHPRKERKPPCGGSVLSVSAAALLFCRCVAGSVQGQVDIMNLPLEVDLKALPLMLHASALRAALVHFRLVHFRRLLSSVGCSLSSLPPSLPRPPTPPTYHPRWENRRSAAPSATPATAGTARSASSSTRRARRSRRRTSLLAW